MQIAGKSVLITGGGGGIGQGMALAFAEQGAKIILADINGDHAATVAAGLPAGTDVMVTALDVTSLESWAAARRLIEARHGLIDVLCNNAGISSGFKPLTAIPPEAFNRIIAINVTGVYNGVISFAEAMGARGSGHIVNTSSMNGLMPHGSFAAYSASKFAVLGLSDALRQELAPRGVGVSTLFPGLTRSRMAETDLLKAVADPQRAEAIRASMMEPVWLGRAVVRAVAANAPYIITHPEYRDNVAARFQEILAAFGEPAQPGYSTGAFATQP
ncbi:SDR family oxidoreductase [Acidocella sp.]|uniref:SDR family NAD(P)-dependent oxidoreductase n=1 Tax=Acidocella sp. TaxID=50710 RepID=UPI002638C317|nr:SDR family oxidoreductase [Acidocella sp.]